MIQAVMLAGLGGVFAAVAWWDRRQRAAAELPTVMVRITVNADAAVDALRETARLIQRLPAALEAWSDRLANGGSCVCGAELVKYEGEWLCQVCARPKEKCEPRCAEQVARLHPT